MIKNKITQIRSLTVTFSQAHKDYPIYPKLKIKGLLDDYLELLTYTISENDYLVPIVIGKKLENRTILIEQFTELIDNLRNMVIRIKNSDFEGWNHFEGKSNFIYPDGTIVHIRKIIF